MKRSHDDFSTMSCRGTLLQQAMQFNNNSDSLFCLPTISSTLHRAPGLPPSDILDESVHSDVYDDDIVSTADDFIETTFDDDEYSSTSNESLEHHMLSDEFTRDFQLAIDDVPVENNVELCTFRRNEIFLPPDILFQVKFLSQMSRHRGNDLNIHSEILELIKNHAQTHSVDFSTLQIMSRQKLIHLLTTHYRLGFLKPTLATVMLTDGTKATVPIFNVKATLLSFLNDPSKMRPENFASNYDIFTGKSTSVSNTIDEIHTGYIWEKARQRYCGDDSTAFPLGLVCFYDKTHTDVFGSLACAPFICIPSFLNRRARNDDRNYMVLGYIPNLGLGKSKSNTQTSTQKLQDEHNCLLLVTNQIKQLHREGGFWTKILGRRVCVKVWIHFIAGDTSGHNNLVGHMNGGTPKFIYRDCRCLANELALPNPKCHLITLKDQEEARQSLDGVKSICKKDIKNAFDNVPLADDVHGLLGCVPPEMLHVSGTGLLKYLFACLPTLIGGPQTKKKDQESFDELHRSLVLDAQRQSEKDIPRMSVRNGITDGTKMAGSERVGNCFILLCVMHTARGIQLTKLEMSQRQIPLKRTLHCLKLYLSFERWITQPNPRSKVVKSKRLLGELTLLIQQCYPRIDGWGWNIPKMHALSKMPDTVLKFGSANNFSGQIGERALKGIVKDHASRTQRRADSFAQQCAQREYESNVVRFVMADIHQNSGLATESSSHCQKSFSGCFRLSINRTNARGVSTENDMVTWADTKKNGVSLGISKLFSFALRQFSFGVGYRDEYSVTGFTTWNCGLESESDQLTIYHATEYMNGKSRYDYAMISFVSDDGKTNTCPAKILGFLKYNVTRGIPTPHLCTDLGLSLSDIRKQDNVDEHDYVIIHAASSYLTWDRLMDEFVVPFHLGDVKTCLYIVKVEAILGPLFVFQNYGGEGKKLFCTLPQRKWAHYFDRRLT